MFDLQTALIMVGGLLFFVLVGVHVAVALGTASLLGIFLVTGRVQIVEATIASTAAEVMRDFTFAVIPLFMLMGEFIGRSGAITDIYLAINRGLRRLPARLGLATVLGNTVFSFVTGVSIASAAAFSRIAYPEMRSFGYHRGFALGTIAGSSCLGMLIPPSVLMIVWGILTEQSIGQIFLAGVLPGLMLAVMFMAYILAIAFLSPATLGEARQGEARPLLAADRVALPGARLAGSMAGVLGIVVSVLGGIWFGLFTPTEGAGAGAALALIFALLKGMRLNDFMDAVFSVGKTAAPILILLLFAALYSRALAMTGVTTAIREFFVASGLQGWQVLAIIIAIWFVLGTVVDSISIMLLTVPIVEPIAMSFGFDRLSFAIVGILAIEAGLLTPPFGLLIYTVKAAIDDPEVGVREIFVSSIPYWMIMLFAAALLIQFPALANWLPTLLM